MRAHAACTAELVRSNQDSLYHSLVQTFFSDTYEEDHFEEKLLSLTNYVEHASLQSGYLHADRHQALEYSTARCRNAGWTDEELYHTATICALFAFYNCWVDCSLSEELSEEGYKEAGRRLAENGYL